MKTIHLPKLTLPAVIALCMAVAFAGCGSGSSNDSPDTTEAETTTAAETTKAEDTGSARDYDITKGISIEKKSDEYAVLKGDGFEITMPNTGTWSYKTNTGEEKSLELYYMPAEEADFGGTLVTLMALDMDDTSYEEFPSYAIAGESKALGKRFIALFVTDVQYDPDDETQATEYPELMHYVESINSTNARSPFQLTE